MITEQYGFPIMIMKIIWIPLTAITPQSSPHFSEKWVSKCKTRGMNRIIVQVRPTGDAIYDSDIFPDIFVHFREAGEEIFLTTRFPSW